MTKTNGRILYFELLRGLAILMIILVHSYQMFTLPSYARIVQRFGMMGCQIFFFISGFFSLRLFTNNSDIWKFYKKKILRIVPAYWLTIVLGAIVVFLCTIVEGENNTGIVLSSKTVVPNILLINGIIPGDANNNVVRGGWFIGTLIILYLLTPFFSRVYYKFKNAHRFVPFICFFICSLVLVIVGLIDKQYICYRNSFMYFSFINQLPIFLLGMSLRKEFDEGLTNNNFHIIGWGGLFLSVVIFYLGFVFLKEYIYIVTPFVFTLSIYWLTKHYLTREFQYESKLCRIFRNVGELDYFIMLIHVFIVFDLNRVIVRFIDINHLLLYILLFPLELVLIYFVAKIYRRVVERSTAF